MSIQGNADANLLETISDQVNRSSFLFEMCQSWLEAESGKGLIDHAIDIAKEDGREEHNVFDVIAAQNRLIDLAIKKQS